MNVLVVDDTKDNRFLITAYLQTEGYGIEVAEDGAEGVQKVQSGNHDLVLMDVEMPTKDGYSATREIRAWETKMGRTPIPVIALTAHDSKDEEVRSRQAGCSDYLSKPVSKAKLLAEIKRHLQASQDEEDGQFSTLPPEIHARVPVYLAGRTRDLKAIKTLLNDCAWDQIQSLAHNMKGSGSSYGFPEITRIGEKLEQAAKFQDAPRVSDHLASLEAVLNSSV